MQENRVVAFLVDRHVGKDRAEVRLFDRRAFFLRTPALMAWMSGAPLVPTFVYRDADGVLVVESGPRIDVPRDGDRDQRTQQATQQVAEAFEARIRQYPQVLVPVLSVLAQPGDRGVRGPRRVDT